LLKTTEFPDGMTIDADGKIWVAGFGNGNVSYSTIWKYFP